MKKIAILFMSLVVTAALAACNSNNKNNSDIAKNNEKAVAPLEAILTVPETAKVGDKIELKVAVTQDGQAFTNIEDVAFEMKNEDTKADKMVSATLQNDAYIASYNLNSAGKYEITAHVSGKNGEHVMPNAELTVTDHATSTNSTESDEHDDYQSTTKSATEEHDHHHEVAITYNHDSTVAKDIAINLSVSLKHDGKALTGADVHYQVLPQFKGGQPTWITLKETSNGTYEAKHTFTQTGQYQLKLHVENNEGLHAHEMKNFTVK